MEWSDVSVVFIHSHSLCTYFFYKLHFIWKIISGNFLRPTIKINSFVEDLLLLLPGGTTLDYIHCLGFFFLNTRRYIFGLHILERAALWVQCVLYSYLQSPPSMTTFLTVCWVRVCLLAIQLYIETISLWGPSFRFLPYPNSWALSSVPLAPWDRRDDSKS